MKYLIRNIFIKPTPRKVNSSQNIKSHLQLKDFSCVIQCTKAMHVKPPAFFSCDDKLEAWKSLNSTSRKNPASIDEHIAPMLINNKFMFIRQYNFDTISSQIQGCCGFYAASEFADYECVVSQDPGLSYLTFSLQGCLCHENNRHLLFVT